MALLGYYQDKHQCTEDLNRDSCKLYSSQLGVVDAIAAIRVIGSALSFMGSVSIISLAIVRKQVFNSKIHPIFMLSIADLLLSILWMIGGSMWLKGIEERVWCFAISLPTVILECVAVNLILVYALLAYSGIKNVNFSNIALRGKRSDQVWHPVVTTMAYLVAWLLPAVIVMIVFGILDADLNLVADANKCSCWCLPVYGNVLPLANATQTDNATAHFVHDVNVLLVVNGTVLGIHHLIVFVLLVIIYSKLLRHIKQIRKEFEQRINTTSQQRGTGMMLITGQSSAKKRIFGFLTVFVMTGILNTSLSCLYLIVQGTILPSGPSQLHFSTTQLGILYIVLCLHAFIVPLQGFLNAIVYGWTREEFIHIMAIGIGHHSGWHVEETVERESESQPLHSSLSKHDTSVTDKTTDE